MSNQRRKYLSGVLWITSTISLVSLSCLSELTILLLLYTITIIFASMYDRSYFEHLTLNVTGVSYIYWLFQPKPDPDKSPSSPLLWWLIATYVALYGLAVQIYESQGSRLSIQAASIAAQLNTTDRNSRRVAFESLSKLQNAQSPIKPLLKTPTSVLRSIWDEQAKNEGIVDYLALNLQMQRYNLTMDPLPSENIPPQPMLNLSMVIGTSGPYNDYKNARMTNTNFTGSFFANADFTNSNLTGSLFNHANLHGAIFCNTTLSYASFKYADLSNAIFLGDIARGPQDPSHLEDTEAKEWGTATFTHAYISGIKGPEKFIKWLKETQDVYESPDEWIKHKRNCHECASK